MKEGYYFMNILFITIAIKDMNGNGLYVDLLKELSKHGINVHVVCPNEKRNNESSKFFEEDSIKFLQVKTGNITKTSFLEKGISTILIERQYIKAIKKYFGDLKFDLVLYTTPPVTFAKVIRYLKRRDNSLSYLMLKDIFPQNAVDLEIIKKNGIIFRFFRYKEKMLYRVSDYIGCTSLANIDYVKKHNPEIESHRIELFPNSIIPRSLKDRSTDPTKIRKIHGIPEGSVLFVYGGNIGRPQGVEYIKKLILRADAKQNFYLMIFGSGTEYKSLKDFINNSGTKNVGINENLSKEEYWNFLSCCDVGLIFLDNRFTVPNTPARLTYYMESALPILAATDLNTDIDNILRDANCGYWLESQSVESFYILVDYLIGNPELRTKLGQNGRLYMEEKFNTSRNYNILLKKIKDRSTL
jgi:glycosyltransferase involved in cell wall biosynthesis